MIRELIESKIEQIKDELVDDNNFEYMNEFLVNYDDYTDSLQKYNLDNEMIEEIIKYIVTNYCAYKLYLRELGQEINDLDQEILQDVDYLSEKDIVNYVRYNFEKFNYILENFFKFYDQNIDFKYRTVANVINKNLSLSFSNLYYNYFYNNPTLSEYIKNYKVIYGLNFIDMYKDDVTLDNIKSFLQVEFENSFERIKFINYVASTVYSQLKVYGCTDEEQVQIVKMIESEIADGNFKKYNKNLILNIFKNFTKIYHDVKWYNFNDIRDKIDFRDATIIFKLDRCYKHPNDPLNDVYDVQSLMGTVDDYINDLLINLSNMNLKDKDIINYFIGILNGEIYCDLNESVFFNRFDSAWINVLMKLYFVTLFYEYANYEYQDLSEEELIIFNKIDDGINIVDAIYLLDDVYDASLIIDKVVEYKFSEDKVEFLTRKKIVDDNRLLNLLNFNNFMFLEYRRVFGSLFPTETSKSTEVGNSLLNLIYEIIYECSNEYNGEIHYDNISSKFKKYYEQLYCSIDDLSLYMANNIYENIIYNDNKTFMDLILIFLLEMDDFDINEYIEDDYILGFIIFKFYSINRKYINDENLRDLKDNSIYKNKKKILRKNDPFYDEDEEILK